MIQSVVDKKQIHSNQKAEAAGNREPLDAPKSEVGLLQSIMSLRPLVSRQQKRSYVLLFIGMLFGAILDLAGLGLIPAFISVVLAPEKAAALPIVGEMIGAATPKQIAMVGLFAIVTAFVSKTVYFFFLFRYQFRLIAKQQVSLSRQLFEAYMRAPWSFHLRHHSSELIRNVNAEALEIVNGILTPLLNILLSGVTTVLITTACVLTLPLTSVGAISGLIVATALLMSRLRTTLSWAGRETKTQRKRTLHSVTEGLSAITDWKLLRREDFMIGRFTQSITRFTASDRYRKTVAAMVPYLVELVAVIAILVAAVLLWVVEKDLTAVATSLVVMCVALVRLRQSVAKVSAALSQMHFSKAAISTVVADVEMLRENTNRSLRDFVSRDFTDQIDFKGVTFRFDPDQVEPTLNSINMTIKRGESVAFVGSTGSGKSTIINLLLGFLSPTEGEVTVDGQSIQPNPEPWQEQIGYVPQTIVLLDDNITRNVAMGIPDDEIDVDRVIESLRVAQLDVTNLPEFPEGLDTVVGERGVRLSGGQRQRLGIARALYRKPSVVVLDEGTSALDSETEAQLMQHLRDGNENVTFVFVAHRISTVTHCDRIYCLKRGQFEEIGNHEELLVKSELYRRLANQSMSTQET